MPYLYTAHWSDKAISLDDQIRMVTIMSSDILNTAYYGNNVTKSN